MTSGENCITHNLTTSFPDKVTLSWVWWHRELSQQLTEQMGLYALITGFFKVCTSDNPDIQLYEMIKHTYQVWRGLLEGN